MSLYLHLSKRTNRRIMPARTSEGQFIADATCSGGNSALSVQYMLTPNADESKTPNENDRDSHCRKRSPNITQCIRVPSSEHVAEIVGRQGCKIKALRARTNTYIKTPTRGQEPIFVITGRKEDVTRAQFEIQLAVDHFTRLRSKHQDEPEQAESDESECTDGGACSSVSPFTSLIAPSSVHAALAHLANIPGNVTALLAVPVHIVGLIVGPKGVTIKRIQHETKTYIVTPSREKDSVFQITGPPEGVERAQREIEQHVLARTGYSVVELMEQRKVMHGSARPSLAESCADSSCSSTSSAATDSLLLGTSPADCHARLQLLHASLRGAKALSRAAAAEANCTPPELHSLLHTPIKQQSLEDCIDWFRPTACRPGRGAIGTHALPARPAGQSWSANGDGIADLLSSKLFIAPSSLVPPAPRSRLLDLQLIAKNAEAQDHCLDEMVANTRNLAHRFSNHQLPVRNCKTPGLDCTVSEMDKSGDEDYCFSGNCFTLPETGFEYLRTQLDAKRRMQS